jgi:molecular chaperone DnaK
LDGILLVGGSCRIPKVQDELVKNFGDKLIKSANLDLAVAEGAAIQADILAGNTNSDILLLDVCPLGLGIETMGGVMTTLIESNTTIPCSKEQIFSTAVDNQTAVTINVLQGERPMAKDNKQIGLFNLDGIAPARRGIPQIKVKFDIDANGILSVSATDNATGKEQHITIENRNTLSQDEIDRIKREAEEHSAEDKKTKERLDKQNQIDGTIYQVENFVEDYKDKTDILTEDDKTYFKEKIEELKTIREGDLSNADNLITEVNQRLASVGSKAYTNNQQSGANPFGFGQQGFNGTNFNDIFTGQNGGNQTNSNEKEDVEEV